jgi:hypothetical protein
MPQPERENAHSVFSHLLKWNSQVLASFAAEDPYSVTSGSRQEMAVLRTRRSLVPGEEVMINTTCTAPNSGVGSGGIACILIDPIDQESSTVRVQPLLMPDMQIPVPVDQLVQPQFHPIFSSGEDHHIRYVVSGPMQDGSGTFAGPFFRGTRVTMFDQEQSAGPTIKSKLVADVWATDSVTIRTKERSLNNQTKTTICTHYVLGFLCLNKDFTGLHEGGMMRGEILENGWPPFVDHKWMVSFTRVVYIALHAIRSLVTLLFCRCYPST